ncbi:MAG: DUF2851 family protein, partial [Eudoraea sp.]|nr:DUF2851 family protein [Eudoraea sp.]
MRESLLHGLWEQQRLPFFGLKLSSGEELQIWDPGKLNTNAGPDFIDARIAIGQTLWVGHVEMHLKSSDWNAHGHTNDANYQNVILHVVWEDDKPILGYHNSAIPTLQLKDFVSKETLVAVLQTQSVRADKLINCQSDHNVVPQSIKEGWWTTLSKQRLRDKSNEIKSWLEVSRNNWEQVLFITLLKSFGLHVNSEAFLSLGLKLDYTIVQKLRHDQLQLEALFLGMSGMLDSAKEDDAYTSELKGMFKYQCNKFSLNRKGIVRPAFLRLRPSNFPTIRLSQLAVLLVTQPRLFGKLMTTYKRSGLHN